MTKMLSITDFDGAREPVLFTLDATGYEQAFHTFAQPDDLKKLAKVLDEGCLFESFSGKSSCVIERDREPLRFWQSLCATIESDNQIWEVVE